MPGSYIMVSTLIFHFGGGGWWCTKRTIVFCFLKTVDNYGRLLKTYVHLLYHVHPYIHNSSVVCHNASTTFHSHSWSCVYVRPNDSVFSAEKSKLPLYRHLAIRPVHVIVPSVVNYRAFLQPVIVHPVVSSGVLAKHLSRCP